MLRLLLAVLLLAPVAARANCPDLNPFYPGPEPDWASTLARLRPLLPQCLESSEYFALYGAAQLNNGLLDESIESLERALLLNPDNGAAQIDYANALLQDGQIFPALQINEQILLREDLPDDLARQIEERQANWQALTRETSWQVDLLAGYDNNLNGAPDQDLITLTLAGDPILLGLNPEFRAVSGPYTNLRLLGRHRRLYPENQQNFSAEIRGRMSEDSASDVVQVAGRYGLIRPDQTNSWQLNAGTNHLLFGGRPLFTGTDASFRYQISSQGQCRPYLGAALQHQLWHNQSRLNGLEAKLGVGTNCPLFNQDNQIFNAELSALNNEELKDNRLGGSRGGWQLALNWQYRSNRGLFVARYNFTRVKDREGFSPLLANNARRDVERNALLLQYQEPMRALGRSALLLINIYHQDQNSNLELFRTEDTTAEIGFSWRF